VITEDYARHSKLLRRFLHKTSWVYPPIELPEPLHGFDIRERWGLGGGPLIGFVGRLAEEKGIETLLASLALVREQVPDARLVMAGPTDAVPGERRARARLLGWIEDRADVMHVGVLSPAELAAFYGTIDVLAVPSTNSTESFGMTQAEAMLAGTPAVASDLPGVREPVRATGMGEVITPGDAPGFASAFVRVIRSRRDYVRPEAEVRSTFDPARTANFYADLFDSLLPELARRARKSVALAAEDREVAPVKRP
jgi:glycosyltransferase involved in cell wall biosynthesis